MAAGFDFFLERLKDKIILSDLVSQKVKLKKRGGHYVGLCPFHNEKSPSFMVQNPKGRYHCFGCGAHGSAIDWVMNTQGMEFMDAVETLARSHGLEVPQDTQQEKQIRIKKSSFIEILDKVAHFFTSNLHSPQGREAMSYLKMRGVSSSMISQFRLGYAPPGNVLERFLVSQNIDFETQLSLGVIGQDLEKGHVYDYFRDRLMFPIFNRQSQIVAFGGRALNDDVMPKYLNSPETRLFHKGELLYAGNFAAKAVREGHELIVVEGYMDVISLHQNGLCGAVAPLGTALGEMQFEEMWRITQKPILCLDGDMAGRKATFKSLERALPLLEPDKLLMFLNLKDGEDPDSFIKKYGKDKFLQEISSVSSTFDYMWNFFKTQQSIKTPEGLALFSKNFKEILKVIGSADLKTAYFEEFYKRYNLEFKNSSGKIVDKSISLTPKLNARKKMLEVLIQAIIIRPQLLPLVEADFLNMRVFEGMESLHKSIVSYYLSNQPLEKDMLELYLKSNEVFTQNPNSLQSVGFKDLLSSSSKGIETAAKEWLELYYRWSDFEEIRNFKIGNIKKDDQGYPDVIRARILELQETLQNKSTDK